MMKTHRLIQTMYLIMASAALAVSGVGVAWGEMQVWPETNIVTNQNHEVQFQENYLEIRKEETVNGQESLYITKRLYAEDLESLEAPSEDYQTEDGGEYELSRWEVKEIPGEAVCKTMERQVVYAGVEGAEELPESITVTEEMTGVPAEGELYIQRTKVLNEAWRDGFAAPVTVHSYGADEYEVGKMILTGDDILSYTEALKEELLSLLGLSQSDYRIHTIEWAGEPYMDETGQLCRPALASGQKLLKDYEITYEGEVSWTEPVTYELNMVYQSVMPPPPPVNTAETIPASGPESELALVPSSEESPLWYWVRSGFVITVAAGLIGILVGMALLLMIRNRERREKRGERYLPEFKG